MTRRPTARPSRVSSLAAFIASLLMMESVVLGQKSKPMIPEAWDSFPCEKELFPGLSVSVGDKDVQLVDMDGDSDLDMVSTYSGGVLVSRNSGEGRFVKPGLFSFDMTGYHRDFAIGDLDGDGDQDLAVASWNDRVCIGWNTGTGFIAGPVFQIADSPGAVGISDIDRDGDKDVVAAQHDGNSVSVSINQGSGVFSAPILYQCSATSGNDHLLVRDLNGDQAPDLLVLNSPGAFASISILLNASDGTFLSAQSYAVGGDPRDFDCGDLDDDGDLDVVVANAGSLFISILVNAGSGSFMPQVPVFLPFSPRAVVCADFDRDGDIDVGAAHSNDAVVILDNDGFGNLDARPTSFGCASRPTTMAAGDMDADGDVDLVVAGDDYPFSSHPTILRNDGNRTFQAPRRWPVANVSASLTLADVDADGDRDLVTNGGTVVEALLNEGSRAFSIPVSSSWGGRRALNDRMADLDGDGDEDIAMVDVDSMSCLSNYGAGEFDDLVSMDLNFSVRGLAVSDSDQDGDIDMVVTGVSGSFPSASPHIACLLNDGAGQFSSTAESNIGAYVYNGRLANVDSDGVPELIAAAAGTGVRGIRVVGNLGGGFFGGSRFIPLIGDAIPTDVFCADLDADSDVDVVVTGSAFFQSIRNDGLGRFTAQADYTIPGAQALGLGDVDGDGDVDIVTSIVSGVDGGFLLLNRGDASFEVQGPYSHPSPCFGVAVGDLDGTGYDDAAFSRGRSGVNYVTVLFSRCR